MAEKTVKQEAASAHTASTSEGCCNRTAGTEMASICASVTHITTKSMHALQQLWLELGVPHEDQAREAEALLREIKNLYQRKTQLYQDERELSTTRIEALQREIAHIRCLFRDDEPHEVGHISALHLVLSVAQRVAQTHKSSTRTGSASLATLKPRRSATDLRH